MIRARRYKELASPSDGHIENNEVRQQEDDPSKLHGRYLLPTGLLRYILRRITPTITLIILTLSCLLMIASRCYLTPTIHGIENNEAVICCIVSNEEAYLDESVESTMFVPLSITRDGSYIVTSINGNQAVVLSYAKGNDDDDDKNTKHSLQTLAILSSNKADDSPIASLDITQDKGKDELSVVAFQSTVGISSLFNISTTSTSTTSMVPQLPQATLQTNENDKLLSFIGSSFSPRTPNESLLLLFAQAKHAGGSAAGSGGNLPMELFSYGSSLEGKVIVGTSLSAAESGDVSKDKKRKAVTTALAPGDQGQESSLASDLMMGAGKKKARVSFGGVEAEEGEEGEKEVAGGEKGDDFLDMDMSDDDEDGEQAQSIAERLALLSSAMEETDDEDDEDDDDEDDDEDGKDSSRRRNNSNSNQPRLKH